MGYKLYLNEAYQNRWKTERPRDAEIEGNFGF